MIVGFTGTREGMTTPQKRRVRALLRGMQVKQAHHGDCIGADDQFHDICRELGIPVVLHPPEDPKYRAFCEGAELIWRPRPYLDRNKDIVMACHMLIACPKEIREPPPMRGQGTWATIRYARNVYKMHEIVWPL